MEMNELKNTVSEEKLQHREHQPRGRKEETKESTAKRNAEGEQDEGNPGELFSGESNTADPDKGRPVRGVRSEYGYLFIAVNLYLFGLWFAKLHLFKGK